MINFLPPEAMTAIKREYFVRAGSVWALLLSAVALVSVALLLPTYMLLVQQLDALALEIVRTESASSTQAYKTAHAELGKAQVLAQQLNIPSPGPTASDVLQEVQKVQLSPVTISGFSYEPTGTSTMKTIKVRGSAETRESLLAFSAALERSPLFARADVPVSDLAKDRDLSFTITIALSSPAP